MYTARKKDSDLLLHSDRVYHILCSLHRYSLLCRVLFFGTFCTKLVCSLLQGDLLYHIFCIQCMCSPEGNSEMDKKYLLSRSDRVYHILSSPRLYSSLCRVLLFGTFCTKSVCSPTGYQRTTSNSYLCKMSMFTTFLAVHVGTLGCVVSKLLAPFAPSLSTLSWKMSWVATLVTTYRCRLVVQNRSYSMGKRARSTVSTMPIGIKTTNRDSRRAIHLFCSRLDVQEKSYHPQGRCYIL